MKEGLGVVIVTKERIYGRPLCKVFLGDDAFGIGCVNLSGLCLKLVRFWPRWDPLVSLPFKMTGLGWPSLLADCELAALAVTPSVCHLACCADPEPL